MSIGDIIRIYDLRHECAAPHFSKSKDFAEAYSERLTGREDHGRFIVAGAAGVTLKAVSTALEIPVRQGTVKAEGDLDFRGTLGVDKEAPVGFRAIRLSFELDTDASQEKIDQLIKLTERYCVIFQTLNHKPELSVASTRT